jgi:hypothetical protein
MAMPSVVLILLVGVSVLTALSQQARCAEAARIGVRAAARGEPTETAHRLAAAAAPPGSRVDITRADGLVTVRIATAFSAIGAARALLRDARISASATAEDEDEASATGLPYPGPARPATGAHTDPHRPPPTDGGGRG